MSSMAKKRPKQDTDYHQASTLVRLADDVAGLMRELAEEGNRALTREVRQALIEYLQRKGKWPPAPST